MNQNNIFKIFFILANLSGLYIFFDPEAFVLFAKIGWMLLLFILFIRPLSNSLPQIKLLRRLVVFRKEIGILCGVFILTHVVGYFLLYGVSVLTFFKNPNFWNINNFLFWGTVGFLVMLPVLVTSNIWSMMKLGRRWKSVQYLTYVFFLGGILHIALFDPERTTRLLLALVILITVRVFVYRRDFLKNHKFSIKSKTSLEIVFLVIIFLVIITLSKRTAPAVEDSLTEIEHKEFNEAPSELLMSSIIDADTPKTLTVSDKCIGCGRCPVVAPKFFVMNRDTYRAEVIAQPLTQSRKIIQSINVCPTDAISYR
jgi:DMSO/TMAO reductase YedYZ heme-binding membrane subunit/ferredoxin